tara:strand:+ start:550 stop:1401 length:852 start_codon:yes stop_codon:yes gene_type:complete
MVWHSTGTIKGYKIVKKLSGPAHSIDRCAYLVRNHENQLRVLKLSLPTDRFWKFEKVHQYLQSINSLYTGFPRSYEHGTYKNMYYIVLSYIRGQHPFAIRNRMGPPGDPKRTLDIIKIIAQLADSLQILHDRGMIYRDLKNENIIVSSKRNQAFIIDLDGSYFPEFDKPESRRSFGGTSRFCSPEQSREEYLTKQTDLYSLGVLLFFLLSNQWPIDSDEKNLTLQLKDIRQKHISEVPLVLSEIVEDIPPQISDLVDSMLAKDPSSRPDSAKDVAKILRQHID